MHRYNIVVLSLFIVIISVSLSLFLNYELIFLEDSIYNAKFPIIKNKESQIIVISIDESTIDNIGQYPFKRSEYAKVIKKILAGKPRVIGIDIFFDGIKDLSDDLRFLKLLNESDIKIVLAVYPREAGNLLVNKFKSLTPNHNFNFKNIELGNVEIFETSGSENITKVFALPAINTERGEEYYPFPIIIASKYLSKDYKLEIVNSSLQANLGGRKIKFPDNDPHILINYLEDRSFYTINFDKVLDSNPSIYHNKIVLIGTMAKSIGDIFTTPISSATPGVIIHANTISSIINNKYIMIFPFHYQVLIYALLSLLITFATFHYKSIVSLTALISTIIVYKILTDFIFSYSNTYFYFMLFCFCILTSYFCAFVTNLLIHSKKEERKERGVSP